MRFAFHLFIFASVTVYGQSPNLEGFLGLSKEQISAVQKLNIDYYDWTAQKVRRIVQVDIELLDEMDRSPLNAKALGLRYAELETIRRERVERRNRLRAQIRTYVTPQQVERLKTLEDSLKYLYVAADAQCENYMAAGPDVCASSFFSYINLTEPGQTLQLTDLLKFTDEQEWKLYSAQDRRYNDAVSQIPFQDEIYAKICRAEGAQPLIPESIGEARAELQLWIRKYKARSKQWEVEARAILTPSQLISLESVEQSRRLVSLIYNAEQFGLLPIGPFGFTTINGIDDNSVRGKIEYTFGGPDRLEETTPSCFTGSGSVIGLTGQQNQRSLILRTNRKARLRSVQ